MLGKKESGVACGFLLNWELLLRVGLEFSTSLSCWIKHLLASALQAAGLNVMAISLTVASDPMMYLRLPSSGPPPPALVFSLASLTFLRCILVVYPVFSFIYSFLLPCSRYLKQIYFWTTWRISWSQLCFNFSHLLTILKEKLFEKMDF